MTDDLHAMPCPEGTQHPAPSAPRLSAETVRDYRYEAKRRKSESWRTDAEIQAVLVVLALCDSHDALESEIITLRRQLNGMTEAMEAADALANTGRMIVEEWDSHDLDRRVNLLEAFAGRLHTYRTARAAVNDKEEVNE